MPIDSTSILGPSGDVVAPPGLKVETPEQKDLFKAALEFERFFLQHMMKQMDSATKAMGETGEGGGDVAASTYRDMANDQLVQSMLDGGGLGLASTLYGQLAEQAGIAGDAGTDDGGVA